MPTLLVFEATLINSFQDLISKYNQSKNWARGVTQMVDHFAGTKPWIQTLVSPKRKKKKSLFMLPLVTEKFDFFDFFFFNWNL
jgi:hypothetical protein